MILENVINGRLIFGLVTAFVRLMFPPSVTPEPVSWSFANGFLQFADVLLGNFIWLSFLRFICKQLELYPVMAPFSFGDIHKNHSHIQFFGYLFGTQEDSCILI